MKEQPLQQVLANGSKQPPTAKETVPEQTLEKKAEVSGPMQTATTSSAVPSVDSKTKAATENGAQHSRNGSNGPVVQENAKELKSFPSVDLKQYASAKELEVRQLQMPLHSQ